MLCDTPGSSSDPHDRLGYRVCSCNPKLLKSCTGQQYRMFDVQFYPCQLKVIRILNFVRRPVVFSLLSNLSNLFAQE